jgi:flagellar basal body P-ring protein FlgI
VAGAGASAGGSKVQINHLSAGRIPGGAQVERAVPTPLLEGDSINWDWKLPTFKPPGAWRRPSTSALARAPQSARWPHHQSQRTHEPRCPGDLHCRMEELPLEASVPSAKVVINSRTGSIVLNQAVILGRMRHCPRQSVGQHQHHTGGQPTQRSVRRTNRGHRKVGHPDQAGARHPDSGARGTPAWPMWCVH